MSRDGNLEILALTASGKRPQNVVVSSETGSMSEDSMAKIAKIEMGSTSSGSRRTASAVADALAISSINTSMDTSMVTVINPNVGAAIPTVTKSVFVPSATTSNLAPSLSSSSPTVQPPKAASVSASADEADLSRELKAAPYFYYRDHSRTPDDDPLTPLTPLARVPNFPAKMQAILSRPDLADVVTWMPHGRSWRVLKPREFEIRVIPTYFDHSKFSSFIRQANGWGFRRITRGKDRNSYYHEHFLRGLPHLCKLMKRPGTSKKAVPQYEPDFYSIGEEHPLPEKAETDYNILLPSTLMGGPKARMPVGGSLPMNTCIANAINISNRNSIYNHHQMNMMNSIYQQTMGAGVVAGINTGMNTGTGMPQQTMGAGVVAGINTGMPQQTMGAGVVAGINTGLPQQTIGAGVVAGINTGMPQQTIGAGVVAGINTGSGMPQQNMGAGVVAGIHTGTGMRPPTRQQHFSGGTVPVTMGVNGNVNVSSKMPPRPHGNVQTQHRHQHHPLGSAAHSHALSCPAGNGMPQVSVQVPMPTPTLSARNVNVLPTTALPTAPLSSQQQHLTHVSQQQQMANFQTTAFQQAMQQAMMAALAAMGNDSASQFAAGFAAAAALSNSQLQLPHSPNNQTQTPIPSPPHNSSVAGASIGTGIGIGIGIAQRPAHSQAPNQIVNSSYINNTGTRIHNGNEPKSRDLG